MPVPLIVPVATFGAGVVTGVLGDRAQRRAKRKLRRKRREAMKQTEAYAEFLAMKDKIEKEEKFPF